MSKVYVVMGSTGEYADRIEGPVAAYTNREAAERHALLANDEATVAYAEMRTPVISKAGNPIMADYGPHPLPHDPAAFFDWPGIVYRVVPIDLYDTVENYELSQPGPEGSEEVTL